MKEGSEGRKWRKEGRKEINDESEGSKEMKAGSEGRKVRKEGRK